MPEYQSFKITLIFFAVVCFSEHTFGTKIKFFFFFVFGSRQANLVFIAYASSEGSGEPAHPRSLARTSAAGSYKQ